MKKLQFILTLIMLLAATGMVDFVQAELIVHYDMEDSESPLVDSVGGQSALEAGSGHVYGIPGPSGMAVGLNENGAWQLNAADSVELSSLVNDFTVAVWVYLDSSISKSGAAANYHRIIGDDVGWDGDAWSFGMRGDNLLFTKNGIIDAFGTIQIAQNEWVHIAAVVSRSAGIEFFVNGIYSETIANTADVRIGNDIFGIGRSYGSGQSQWFAGNFDEVRVYDTVLDDEAIAELAYSNVTYPVRLVSPADGVMNVSITAEPTLEWISGTDEEIVQHVLYFSSDQDWVTSALPTDSSAIVLDVTTETYQMTDALEHETTYYWRVDEAMGDLNNPDNIETGPVWSFLTKAAPVPPCAGLRFDGDINGDCFVDILDLTLFAQDWMITETTSSADIDEDSIVNLADFAYIGRDWQQFTNSNDLNILVVAAHPDDEGIFGGGILPYYAQAKGVKVTLMTMVTRNSNGNDPLMSGSKSRVQEIRNAVDVFAGQELDSGTFNELGHYITGNMTHIAVGLIDTGCCGANPFDSWSDSGDGYGWGISSGTTLVTPGYGNMDGLTEGRDVAAWVIAREIRRCQPEVIVSVHDLEGDYGHSNHVASVIGIIEAYELAADGSVDIDGLAPWLSQKLYVRGDSYDNRNTITWSDFASDGGINSLFHDYMEDTTIDGISPRTVADWGLNQHSSQGSPDVSTVFRASENYNGHHSEWWTLYRSSVGPDTTATFTVSGDTTNSTYNGWAIGDFLENISTTN